MSPSDPDQSSAWHDATLAAALCAVDPHQLGGVHLKALSGPVRTEWLRLFGTLLVAGTPRCAIPVHVTEDRLLGGLDLTATLRAGRPVIAHGLLAEANGGVVILAMAERAARSTVSHLCTALDSGVLPLQRDGMQDLLSVRLGVIAVDESVGTDEAISPALAERLGLYVDLSPVGLHDMEEPGLDPDEVLRARQHFAQVTIEEDDLRRLCEAAYILGIDSLRTLLLAGRVARASAALSGRDAVASEDLEVAARLLLAPRATSLPAVEEEHLDQGESGEDETPSPEPDIDEASSPEVDRDETNADNYTDGGGPIDDTVLAAALASIPARLLASLKAGGGRAGRTRTAGKSGALRRSQQRGRPLGTVPGDPRRGARLSLVGTLRAAAPWQGVRRAEVGDSPRPRILVRREDMRVTRFKQRSESTTVFVVDASGSAALHRLAEAKGAVELLLADCYVRRDQVALIAFRGTGAELLLPPTRSLVRAKRSLADLPGGGGTPLAAAIVAASELVDQVNRKGGTPVVIMLTDGRANVALDGAQGREKAFEDAIDQARAFRLGSTRVMVVDTSTRPHENARRLADGMSALYLPLPHADATSLSRAVRSVAPVMR
jgi:magnesium chelatase subunit D